MSLARSALVLAVAAACLLACGDDDSAADAASSIDATVGTDASSAADGAVGTVDAVGAGDASPDTSVYSAEAMPGGLDRVFITRVNANDQTCMRMVLVSPAGVDDFDIDVPNTWQIEQVALWQQTSCTGPADEQATGGTGAITFGAVDMFGLYPCSLTAQCEIDSPGPTTTTWAAQNVPVVGVVCN